MAIISSAPTRLLEFASFDSIPLTLLIAAFILLASLTRLTYQLIWSPLSKLPGPWYTKVTGLCLRYHEFNGSKRIWTHNMHSQYGDVVRLTPNEVSFASPAAVKDIYTSAGGFVKTEMYSLFRQEGHTNLFTTLDKKDHNQKKKRMADRYSNTAILKGPVLEALRDRSDAFATVCGTSKSVDIYLYLHAYALDCATVMLFHPFSTKSIEGGQDLEMIRALSYHDSRRAMVLRHWNPWLETAYKMCTTSPPMKGGNFINDYAWSSMRKKGHSEFTLASRFLEHPEIAMSEMVAECLDHIGAGVDTTGDTLCFLMWELSQPHSRARMERLNAELRDVDPINGKLDTLPYLNAVVEEALRLWAPGTMALPRYVPHGGKLVDGYYIPGDTIVGVQSYTMHRRENLVFPQSDTFMPERWLEPDVERQRWMFAFGAGARTCVGKFLALAEIRLLLHSVYSRYRSYPAEDMDASMEMSDQMMTTRPKDMLCKLRFEPFA